MTGGNKHLDLGMADKIFASFINLKGKAREIMLCVGDYIKRLTAVQNGFQ